MFQACVQRFDVTRNLEKFCKILGTKHYLGAPVCFDQDVQHSPIRQISLLAVQSNAGGCAADAVVSSRATPV